MTARPAALLIPFLLLASGCPQFHAGPVPNAPKDATFLVVDGVRMHYTDQGQGPAVVLLHGYGASMDSWIRLAPELARSFRVIALDLKGFGFTSRPAGDYSPAAQAQLVWHLLDKRGVKDVAVVAHSWGASVALEMALEQPGRVRRVALYDAFVYEAQIPSFFLWSRAKVIGELLFGLYYRENLEERYALGFYDDSQVTARRLDIAEREFSRPGTVAAALATARGQRFAKVEKRYHTIDKPTLLLWGRDDIVTPLHFAERLAEDLPNARLVAFPRCGHFPMFEAMHRSTRELVGFLGEDLDRGKQAAAAQPPAPPAAAEVGAAPEEAVQ